MTKFIRYFSAFWLTTLFEMQAMALPPTSDDFDSLTIGGSQYYSQPKSAPGKARSDVASIAVAKIEILLDQRGFSPGVIDGRATSRFHLALATHNRERSNERLIVGLSRVKTDPLFNTYTITQEDISGPFTPDIPELYVDQAKLPRIGYRNVIEMLAERFHMDEDYLRALNPGTKFERVGTKIRVANIGRDLQKRVVRIEADKSKRQVRAFTANDELVAAYPASIGSESTPSPSGTHTVKNKAQSPQYTYDPKGSAQPGLSDGLVRLPAGPNSPVGNAWIGLSKPTYGIHGTPEPSQIGVTASVGCVRLTNWDALELARLVRRGVKITFVD